MRDLKNPNNLNGKAKMMVYVDDKIIEFKSADL